MFKITTSEKGVPFPVHSSHTSHLNSFITNNSFPDFNKQQCLTLTIAVNVGSSQLHIVKKSIFCQFKSIPQCLISAYFSSDSNKVKFSQDNKQ